MSFCFYEYTLKHSFCQQLSQRIFIESDWWNSNPHWNDFESFVSCLLDYNPIISLLNINQNVLPVNLFLRISLTTNQGTFQKKVFQEAFALDNFFVLVPWKYKQLDRPIFHPSSQPRVLTRNLTVDCLISQFSAIQLGSIHSYGLNCKIVISAYYIFARRLVQCFSDRFFNWFRIFPQEFGRSV